MKSDGALTSSRQLALQAFSPIPGPCVSIPNAFINVTRTLKPLLSRSAGAGNASWSSPSCYYDNPVIIRLPDPTSPQRCRRLRPKRSNTSSCCRARHTRSCMTSRRLCWRYSGACCLISVCISSHVGRVQRLIWAASEVNSNGNAVHARTLCVRRP